MINHFTITSRSSARAKTQIDWYLVDLPGYGYAKVSQKNRKSWGNMIEHYLRKRANLLNTFVLIDSRHEPQKIDLEFVNQMGAWRLPFAIVFTKADKMKPGGLDRNVHRFLETLQADWEELPPHFVTSASTGLGREEILHWLGNMLH